MDLPESQEQFEQEPTDELAEEQSAPVEAKPADSSADQKPVARSETQIPTDLPLIETTVEGPAWYVIHCYSGYENKVRHNLEQRIETMGMKDKIFDVVIPTQEEVEVKDGKRRTVERHVFPGYVLVNMIMSEESWYVVRNTPGVTGFVGMGTSPTPLRPEEVNQIIKRMEAEKDRPLGDVGWSFGPEAIGDKKGLFEEATGGTIFLDEIGDIPPATQVKLLRVLEEKEIERVGDHTTIPVDVRIITATNKNLEDLVARGAFREDLYFRIHVFPLTIPPLRERPEDIPIIIQHFVEQNHATSGKKIAGLSPEAVARLTSYTWPGNVRELRNAIEYALVLCPGGEIDAHHLPHKIAPASDCPPPAEPPEARERDELVRVLRQVGGNQSAAARQLGVSRVTVWKRMKKHHIDLTRDVT